MESLISISHATFLFGALCFLSLGIRDIIKKGVWEGFGYLLVAMMAFTFCIPLMVHMLEPYIDLNLEIWALNWVYLQGL